MKLALALLFPAMLLAREDFTRNFDKTTTMPTSQRLRVEHRLGDIVIRTQSKGQLEVHAVIRVSASDEAEAKRIADRIRVEVGPSGSAMLIETLYPKQDEWGSGLFGHHNISYSVNYEILMPETAPLELRSAFGAVSVSNLKAGSHIVAANGKLEFRNGRGNQELEDKFGAVEVRGNSGDVILTNTNGSVDLEDITGRIDIRNRFGKITATRCGGGKIVNGNGAVELSSITGDMHVTTSFAAVNAREIKGSLSVNNQNGEVEAVHVDGPAELYTSFARIQFEDIHGSLTAKSANSAIKGSRVAGSARLQTSFAPVEVSEIQKGLTVVAQNGSVDVREIGEDLSVKTSFGSVKAQEVGGAIEVADQNGSVDVAAHQKNCKPISIGTTFGPIRVHVSEDASYAVTARTSFGQIHSDFPMMVSGSLSPDAVSGKIGGGACPMTLTGQNGSIDILKK